MSKKLMSVSSLKVGSYIIMDDAACKVSGLNTSRPGKDGHAKVSIVAVGLIDNKKRATVMPGHDNVEVPIVDKRTAQVLSIHGDAANVMDSETYETFDMKIPDELKESVKEGVNILYWVILTDKVMKQIKQ